MSDTLYSQQVPGSGVNWNKTTQFDIQDGIVGISQWQGDKIDSVDRVLLTKQQTVALRQFLEMAK